MHSCLPRFPPAAPSCAPPARLRSSGPRFLLRRILGANEKINLGLIGAGERGRGVMGSFIKTGGVNVTAVCDVYAEMIDRAQKAAPSAKGFADYRKLLEQKDVDAVLIGTPDHWHATNAIDALNAGKDVYVEKPLTRTIEEGPSSSRPRASMSASARSASSSAPAPTTSRPSRSTLDTNALGRITLVRTWWHGNTYHLRKAPESLATRPSNLDWARFLGPVKWRDWDPQQFWNWRAYLDFGGGQVTDLFTHWIDVVHMFLGRDIPTSGVAAGGVYHYKDGRTAPDTINVLLEYGGDYTVTFEATLAPGIRGEAIEFCGTEGRLWISRARYEFTPAAAARFPSRSKAPATTSPSTT
jgi:predicted dehydrogenase